MSRSGCDSNESSNKTDESDSDKTLVEPLTEESYLPTDVTGYFALAQMPTLRRVSIPECLVRFLHSVIYNN